MNDKQKYIKELAKKNNAIILAHYYVADEIQEIADFLGDSLYLTQKAKEVKNDVILFCGVNFMAETTKILNPNKKVIVPDNCAYCSLADNFDVLDCIEWKSQFNNPYLISYINSSTEIKTISDIICTSSNAINVVQNAPKDATLLFATDVNLGSWLNKKLGINMKLWNGNCVVHHNYSEEGLKKLIKENPTAEVIAHPECTENILKYANFIGSTTGIINYSKQSNSNTFIVLTEEGVHRKLKIESPNKTFLFVPNQKLVANICINMKKHTLDKVISALETLSPEIKINEKVRELAAIPLERMLSISI
ncbi:MAG: quinolinate synthase NadA [Bacteroidetes bacterium]|nr:quinolinate synthase NadA [Bacteroidota bacterium]